MKTAKLLTEHAKLVDTFSPEQCQFALGYLVHRLGPGHKPTYSGVIQALTEAVEVGVQAAKYGKDNSL